MVKIRTLTALVIAVLLGLTLGTGVGFTEDAPQADKPAPPKKMVINGMSFGVLRVPEVAVWSCPGGGQGGCLLVGKVKHGTEVMRYESEKARGLKWDRVTADGIEGWVLDTFVKPLGT
jgi:hypothetical protein